MTTALSLPAQATLLAYEGFDTASANGTDVTIVGVTGSGFSGYTNTNFRMDTEDGLSYSDGSGNTLVSTGKSAGMEANVSGTQNLWLDLSSPIVNSGQTIYFSFLTDVTAVDSWDVMAGLVDTYDTDSESPNDELEAGFRSTSSNWGIYSDNNGIDERTGPATGTGQYFVVSELNLGTGGMTTYLNPTDLENIAGTAANTLTDTATATLNTIEGFVFGLGNDAAGTVDEIRIGTTLGDVSSIPEPATIGLLGVVSAGILFVRRRFGRM